MEKDWTEKQKQFHEIKISEKIEKGKNQSMYTQKCLQQCKGWNEPATSVEELHMILKSNPFTVTHIKLMLYISQICSEYTTSVMMNNYSTCVPSLNTIQLMIMFHCHQTKMLRQCCYLSLPI